MNIVSPKSKISKDELISVLKNAIGVIAGTEIYDKDVLNSCKDTLKCISRKGSGVDNIDIDYCKKLGIKILTQHLDVVSDSVAELTIWLMISLLRQPFNKKRIYIGENLIDKRIGIVGNGQIGSRVIKLLRSFGCRDIYVNDIIKTKSSHTIEEVFKHCNFISLHFPLNKQNYQFINRKLLRQMDGGFLINTARADIVDNDYLYNELDDHAIWGFASDVIDNDIWGFKNLDNVILTPHIGSYTWKITNELLISAKYDCVEYLNLLHK